MSAPLTQSCENCRFYRQGRGQGFCRAMPPVMVRTNTDYPQSCFTFTEPHWWCGMWQSRDAEDVF